MTASRVTVICLCYNQGRFVKDAIDSVLHQTWPEVQLIVLDDASVDDSASVIQTCVDIDPQITFLHQQSNTGNCRAFNRALAYAQGEYIIDLAADDILLPDRVQKGVEALTKAGDAYGVNFTDAEWIAEDGRYLYTHSDRFPHDTIAEGDVYRELIRRYFICSPTMMFRRSVIDTLHGYDEELAYEDFDFWIRSARTFLYAYTPEVLVKKRVVKNSMSQRQFSLRNVQTFSTFRVCEKIMSLNRSAAEQQALAGRILYEMRLCLRLLNFSLAAKYLALYLKNSKLKY